MSELTTFPFRLAPEPAQPLVPELCPFPDLDHFFPVSVAAELLDALEAKCVQVKFVTHGYGGCLLVIESLSQALSKVTPASYPLAT